MFLKEHGGTTFALVKKKSLYWFSMRRLLRTSNSKALFFFHGYYNVSFYMDISMVSMNCQTGSK